MFAINSKLICAVLMKIAKNTGFINGKPAQGGNWMEGSFAGRQFLSPLATLAFKHCVVGDTGLKPGGR